MNPKVRWTVSFREVVGAKQHRKAHKSRRLVNVCYPVLYSLLYSFFT